MRGNVTVLRRVARELREALAAGGRQGYPFKLKVGEEITPAACTPLRRMAEAAARELPAAARTGLADRLLGFVPEASKLAEALRGPVTDELLAGMRWHFGPILAAGERPRDASAQRHTRLARATVRAYDVGHFVPHCAGGPARINCFRQERRLNRGWSAAGRAYRWLERYVAARPGTFYFVRPVYGAELSDTPRYLEWGVLVEAAEAARLAAGTAANLAPAIEILTPPAECAAGTALTWLLGWFENFPAGATQLDLGAP